MKVINMKKISTSKPFAMAIPKTTRVVKYKKIMVHFLDKDGNPMNRARQCSYGTDNQGNSEYGTFIRNLKAVYKNVQMLDRKDGMEQVSIVLEEGQDLNQSFDKVGAAFIMGGKYFT